LSILKLIWPFALFVLVLANCSEFQHNARTDTAPVVTRGYGTDYWLAELHKTRTMTPDEIQKTLKSWEQELNNHPGVGNQIKLALLLTTGDASIRDPKRARVLLDGLDLPPDNTSDQELVTILRQMIDEQDQANMAISTLKKQTRKQTLHIKELEQQQRALTDIEQKIQQREIPPSLENDGQ
jgi:hypothetical protein